MHRVFDTGITQSPVSQSAATLRAFLRSLGLEERAIAGSYVYTHTGLDSVRRQFATLHAGLHSATIYLYPDALGQAGGSATRFYRVLDDAGLGMGSKAGPSIGIDLDDAAQVMLFRDGLTTLLAAAPGDPSRT